MGNVRAYITINHITKILLLLLFSMVVLNIAKELCVRLCVNVQRECVFDSMD